MLAAHGIFTHDGCCIAIRRHVIAKFDRVFGVSFQIDAPDGLPPVVADAVNLQQVMVNLMMNGAQAMMEPPRLRRRHAASLRLDQATTAE